MELSEKAKRRLRRLSDCFQVEESEILDRPWSFCRKEIGKALRAWANASVGIMKSIPRKSNL